jgi:outer membrane protein
MKRLLLITALFVWQLTAHAANLIEVYQQALCSDPVFQQAIAHSLVTKDNVPISISSILPNISLFTNPRVTRYGFSGSAYKTGSINDITFFSPRNLTQRTYTLDLTIQQPVFDLSLYTDILVQFENSKRASAILNAALQNLMIRVSSAYFAILKDEEEIIYTSASKRYYRFQLNQVKDQFQAGLKTITDVYTARAAYESAVSALIVANKKLANDRENLRAMTGIYYHHLSDLKMNLPLVLPTPNDIDQWVTKALIQNWTIKAEQYSLQAAKQNITQQQAGHFPTISFQTTFERNYFFNINRYPSYIDKSGAGVVSDRFIGFNIDMPLFEGGGVISKTKQAVHFYKEQQFALEKSVRNTVNNTRQSYMNIVAGISQIKADKHLIYAAQQSLQGTIDRYNSGIQTLLDVLNREESLYEAQINYAIDRYDYVNNILLLKEAAGTLNFGDLCVVNSWLTDSNHAEVHPFQDKLLNEALATIHKNKSQKRVDNKNVVQKNRVRNPIVDWTSLIAEMKETRIAYKKLENEHRQSNAEMNKLKMSISELKQELQNKTNQLKRALEQGKIKLLTK